MPANRPMTIVAAVLLGTAALSGCGTAQSTSSAPRAVVQPSTTQFSGTDVQFVQPSVQAISTLQQDTLDLVNAQISTGEDRDAEQLATQIQATANATLQQLRGLAGATPTPTPSPTS